MVSVRPNYRPRAQFHLQGEELLLVTGKGGRPQRPEPVAPTGMGSLEVKSKNK